MLIVHAAAPSCDPQVDCTQSAEGRSSLWCEHNFMCVKVEMLGFCRWHND